MPDPEMVSRAHRAATRLERAWDRWRSASAPGGRPVSPVSSYVGYSIEEPWGRPRVVVGVDADEADRLAALLDRQGPRQGGLDGDPGEGPNVLARIPPQARGAEGMAGERRRSGAGSGEQPGRAQPAQGSGTSALGGASGDLGCAPGDAQTSAAAAPLAGDGDPGPAGAWPEPLAAAADGPPAAAAPEEPDPGHGPWSVQRAGGEQAPPPPQDLPQGPPDGARGSSSPGWRGAAWSPGGWSGAGPEPTTGPEWPDSAAGASAAGGAGPGSAAAPGPTLADAAASGGPHRHDSGGAGGVEALLAMAEPAGARPADEPGQGPDPGPQPHAEAWQSTSRADGERAPAASAPDAGDGSHHGERHGAASASADAAAGRSRPDAAAAAELVGWAEDEAPGDASARLAEWVAANRVPSSRRDPDTDSSGAVR